MKARKKKPARRCKAKPAAVKPARIVSDRVIGEGKKVFHDWLWQTYRGRHRPVGHLAAEIGLSRQGLTKVLRRQSAFQFTTFLRALFLQPEGGGSLAIAAEGWKMQLRWTLERSNGSYLSDGCVAA